MLLEELGELGNSLLNVLGAIVEIHVVGALDNVKALVPGSSSLDKILRHPLAAGVLAKDNKNRLSQVSLGLVVGIVGNDLGQRSGSHDTRRVGMLSSGSSVVLPGSGQLFTGSVFLLGRSQRNSTNVASLGLGRSGISTGFDVRSSVSILDGAVPAVSEHLANVDVRNCANGLDSGVNDGSIGNVSSTSTDAHGSNIVGVHKGLGLKVVDHGTDVVGSNRGVLQLTRFSSRGSLI